MSIEWNSWNYSMNKFLVAWLLIFDSADQKFHSKMLCVRTAGNQHLTGYTCFKTQ